MEDILKKFLKLSLIALLITGCATDGPKAPKKTTDSLLKVAAMARKTGNSETSINFYNKVIKMDPKNAKAYLGMAEAYIDLKLLDAALEYIKKAEANGGDKNKAHYLKGKVHLLLGNIEKAEREFHQSKSVDALNALGAICDNKGDHRKAQQYYKQVIAKSPEYIDAYNNLGLSLMLSNKYKDAIFYLESACTLPDAGVVNRSNLALVYGLSGNFNRAREIYSKDFEGQELEQKIAYLQDLIAAKRK